MQSQEKRLSNRHTLLALNESDQMNTTTKAEPKRIAVPNDGGVLVTVETSVTEKEIFEARNEIVLRLEGAYNNLVFEMKEFQERWDADPIASLYDAAIEGGHAGSAEWLSDQEEMLSAAYWNEIGVSIKNSVGGALDSAAIEVVERYEKIKTVTNRHLDNPHDTILNWAWWQKKAVDTSKDYHAEQRAKFRQYSARVQTVVESVDAAADMSAKIYFHRKAILALPETLVANDRLKIKEFIDVVLTDIDPKLAREVKENENVAIFLTLLNDHDSILSYLSYAGLMLEAIPPNFFVYVAGKGGAQLLIEVVLLIVTAVLSAGAAAAARVGMLVARLAGTSVRLASANRRIRRAQQAIDSATRVVEDLSRAAGDLHQVGYKLLEKRSISYTARSSTKSTIHAKQTAIKRDAKCKVCGSSKHKTPRRRRGTITYE